MDRKIKRRLKKRRDMEHVQGHLKMMLETQDGSTVLTFTQFTYNISFTHTKNP